jgi:hypothetical protein
MKSFSIIYYHALIQDATVSTASVAHTSQVVMSAMLVLLCTIRKYEFRVTSNSIISVPNLIKIHPAIIELKHVDRHDQSYVYYARNNKFICSMWHYIT